MWQDAKRSKCNTSGTNRLTCKKELYWPKDMKYIVKPREWVEIYVCSYVDYALAFCISHFTKRNREVAIRK